MKKLIWISLISFIFSGLIYSQQPDNTMTNKAPSSSPAKGSILLPDVPLNIIDESEIPLRDQEGDLLDESNPALSDIDIGLLTSTRTSDLLIIEMMDERTNETFSLSTFKLYYGLYENLVIDINLGKSIKNFNYLVTYLRNKRGPIGYNGTNYYNTELNIDDLNLDFIYSLSRKVDLNTTLGYYQREIGLYQSGQNLSESKLTVPFKADLIYNIDKNSQMTGRVFYRNLWLNHKKTTGIYQEKLLWEGGVEADYQANWIKDNFLKANARYNYSGYDVDSKHEADFGFVDKFAIVPALALELGAHFYLYSYKSFFWYPEVFLHLKHKELINFKAGVNGMKESLAIDTLIKENQIGYTNVNPTEAWVYSANFSLTPSKIVTFKLNGDYRTYGSYMTYYYLSSTDLYYFRAVTNLNVVNAEASVEISVAEQFMFSASYQFSLPSDNTLLFLSQNTAALNLEYRHPRWRFQTKTRVAYEDIQFFLPGQYKASSILWDWDFSQALTREVYLEVKLNNILNQQVLVRPQVPTGGFMANIGIKILL